MGAVYLAFDREMRQKVALKIVRGDAKTTADVEAMRQETACARRVSHRNVCRVHDLQRSEHGPVIVMEYVAGETLHNHIRRGGLARDRNEDEFRRIASEASQGLAAIHREDLVHGDLKPGNVMVTDERVVILDFGLAQERARVSANGGDAGGTPNYMAPERLRRGGASREDDVYALGLTLWEMWTSRVPQPGSKPRRTPMAEQLRIDIPTRLSLDETKQVWRCLAEEPAMRPEARQLRFFKPGTLTAVEAPRERLDAGPQPGPASAQRFVPGAQSLLVTYASGAPEVVGELMPLTETRLRMGRRAEQDIVLPDPTISAAHALLSWQDGQWRVEDLGSTNGTYLDFPHQRIERAVLLHGSEVELGEVRLKLVSFGVGTPQHERARAYLTRRDGLTGLLRRRYLESMVDDEALFAEWAACPMTVARYDLRVPGRTASARPTILELLALRAAARRAEEQTEHLLMSLLPVTLGLTGPLGFAVVMVGPSLDEARQIVEVAKAQASLALPDSMQLVVTITQAEPGKSGRMLLD
jgi:serine/threonine-protein kinase